MTQFSCDEDCFNCKYPDCMRPAYMCYSRPEKPAREEKPGGTGRRKRQTDEERREKRREYMRAYGRAHREERQAYARAYNAAHREQIRAYSRARYAKQKEEKERENKGIRSQPAGGAAGHGLPDVPGPALPDQR